MQARDRRDRHDDSERPVVLAGVPDGIEMRTQQQRRLSSALEPPSQIADVVAPNGHARLAHPVANQHMRAPHRVRGEWPGDRAGLLGALGQVMAPLDDDSRQRHDDSVKGICAAHLWRAPWASRRATNSRSPATISITWTSWA